MGVKCLLNIDAWKMNFFYSGSKDSKRSRIRFFGSGKGKLDWKVSLFLIILINSQTHNHTAVTLLELRVLIMVYPSHFEKEVQN